MLSKLIINYMNKELCFICQTIGFDVAILFKIDRDELKVVKIFGDHFARPDLTERHAIDRTSKIYLNEKFNKTILEVQQDFSQK